MQCYDGNLQKFMTIREIENEFNSNLRSIISEFNDPDLDYLGVGFGLKGIAGILGVDEKTLERWCKKMSIKIKKRRRLFPLDDLAWVKYNSASFEKYLERASFAENWRNICEDFNISWHTLHKRFTNHDLYNRNPFGHWREQRSI